VENFFSVNLTKQYDVFFFGSFLFLLGIILASLKINFLGIASLVVLVAVIFLPFEKKFFWLNNASLLILLVLVGVLYYQLAEYRYRQHQITFNQKTNFEAVITDDPISDLEKQTFPLRLLQPLTGKVLAVANVYPAYRYGDLLSVTGVIQPPPDSRYGLYLIKEGFHGILKRGAVIELITGDQGNNFVSYLIGVKRRAIAAYQKLLAGQQATFLAGITLGEAAEFSKEFLNRLSLSGTRHLIALSGMHLVIITQMVSRTLKKRLSRRLSFLLTFLFIVLFLIMTGLKVSALRAAFMALVLSLAGVTERLYSPRNSLIFTALALTLINPQVLVFDTGFQLSLLAAAGILYLEPVLEKLTKINLKRDKGFFNWKENLLVTFSAQLATAPLLITQFSNFTLTALAANFLILTLVAPTMFLGLIIGLLYYLFLPLATVVSWLAAMLLQYQIFIIDLFSQISLPFNPNLHWLTIVLYYLLLLTAINWSAIRSFIKSG